MNSGGCYRGNTLRNLTQLHQIITTVTVTPANRVEFARRELGDGCRDGGQQLRWPARQHEELEAESREVAGNELEVGRTMAIGGSRDAMRKQGTPGRRRATAQGLAAVAGEGGGGRRAAVPGGRNRV